MLLPDFPLPSDISKIISFRAPTVADCMAFAELDPNYEEQLTTQYLNRLQESPLLDSGDWTGEDRRTALWWIFISSREDKTMSFSYHCDICDADHYPVIDLTTLGETAMTVAGKPYRDVTITKDGKEHAIRVHPLSGYALEHLEQIKNRRNEQIEGSGQYRIAANQLAMNELLHSFDVLAGAQPEGHNEALDFKRDFVESMNVDSEFKPFSVAVELALRELRHGILCQYHDGGYLMLANRPACDKEDKNRTYPILLPFRAVSFIPNL